MSWRDRKRQKQTGRQASGQTRREGGRDRRRKGGRETEIETESLNKFS